ncbi:hypothetical protein HZA39_03365 [Candidatus Peregrinibacteria bacterium]|nr:hypothetical protein [Candidatus Peregrinibacteria bacterium]
MEHKIIQTRTPLSVEIKKTIIYLLITLTALIIGLSAYFLLQTGNTTQRGYMLKQLQLQHENLQQQNEKLDEQLTEMMSSPALEKNPFIKKMQEPTSKVYVK